MISAAILNILFALPNFFAILFLGKRVYRYCSESQKLNAKIELLFGLGLIGEIVLFFALINLLSYFSLHFNTVEKFDDILAILAIVVANAIMVVYYLLISKYIKKIVKRDCDGALILSDSRYNDKLFYYAMKEYNVRYKDEPVRFTKLYPNGIEQFIEINRGLMKIRKCSVNVTTISGNAVIYEYVFNGKETEAIDYIADDIKGRKAVEFCKKSRNTINS